MFLGSVVYDKRRSLNLTQSDLANGVCNQNTISKMEKHNMTPQIDVLIKICHRLDLSLNDVFSDFSSDNKQEQVFVLDSIEESALLSELAEIDDKLSLVKNSISGKDAAQFDFIQGLIEFQRDSFEKCSFNLDKVLQETKSDNDNIYTLMAYLLKGMVYSAQKHAEMSGYYFNIVNDSLTENLNVANASSLEILYLCKLLGKSYQQLEQYSQAMTISKRGIEFANENHVSYFIDELNFTVALAIKDDAKEAQRYRNIAYYCADLLGHTELQTEITKKLN